MNNLRALSKLFFLFCIFSFSACPAKAATLNQSIGFKAGPFFSTGMWAQNFDIGYYSAFMLTLPLPFFPYSDFQLSAESQVSYLHSKFTGYSGSSLSNAASLIGPKVTWNYSRFINPSLSLLGGISYTNLKLQSELTLDRKQLSLSAFKPAYSATISNELLITDSITLDIGTTFQSTILNNSPLEGFIVSGAVSYQANFFQLQKEIPLSSSSIEILDLELVDIIPSQHFSINSQGIGVMELKAKKNIEYVQIATKLEDYGRRNQSGNILRSLNKGETVKVLLPVTIDTNVLGNNREQAINLEIAINYQEDSRNITTKVLKQVSVYPRNFFNWDQKEAFTSFITPRNAEIFKLARKLTKPADSISSSKLDDRTKEAMTIFNSLSAVGIRYEADPELGSKLTAANKTKGQEVEFDYILFANETLAHEAGDCEDLVILYSSLLESVGTETALLLFPDHIMLMYNTGISLRDTNRFFKDEKSIFKMHGKAWVPIEVTEIQNSFARAWSSASIYLDKARVKKIPMEIILVRAAWESSPPVETNAIGFPEFDYDKLIEEKFEGKMTTDLDLISKAGY